MRVKVTLSNILEYGLDVVTGNSRSALLARAKELEENGYELYVNIPDVTGGDTEAPVERNAFEHYNSELPEPDGFTHTQESLNLEEQAVVIDEDTNVVSGGKIEMKPAKDNANGQ